MLRPCTCISYRVLTILEGRWTIGKKVWLIRCCYMSTEDTERSSWGRHVKMTSADIHVLSKMEKLGWEKIYVYNIHHFQLSTKYRKIETKLLFAAKLFYTENLLHRKIFNFEKSFTSKNYFKSLFASWPSRGSKPSFHASAALAEVFPMHRMYLDATGFLREILGALDMPF